MENNVVSFEEEKRKYLLRDKVLVESSFSITATENKILYCILQNAQVRRNEEVHCVMSASDFYKVVSKTEHKTPKYIKECLNKLMDVKYKFWDEKIEGSYNLISGFTRDKETQVFKISMPQEIHKRIMKQSVYSPLDLQIITSLKSFYSQRLYEMLRLWSRNDEERVVAFTVDYVRFILGAENVCKEFKHLNQYIKKSIKEIESKTNMKIECDPIKEGRKTVKLRFTLKDGDIRTFSDSNKSKKTKAENKNANDSNDDNSNNKMTAEVRKVFESDFDKYHLNNPLIHELYEQCCEATLSFLKAKKIGRNQYPYFKEMFTSRLVPLDAYKVGWKTECI